MLAAAKETAGFLDSDLAVFIWTLLTFVLLLLVLWKWAWGPLSQALDAREKKIQERFDEASQKISAAESKLAEYQARLDGAKGEVASLLAKGRADAEVLRSEIIEGGRKEAARALERARHEMDLARDQAAHELRQEVAALSTEIASRVLERAIDPAEHEKFIEKCLESYEEAGEQR